MFPQRWMRHELIWRWLSSALSVCGHVFGGGVALETDYAERVGSYAFKASLLLLASLKSPTLPLNHNAFIWHKTLKLLFCWQQNYKLFFYKFMLHFKMHEWPNPTALAEMEFVHSWFYCEPIRDCTFYVGKYINLYKKHILSVHSSIVRPVL